MPEIPAKTMLIPNTQPVYCQYQPFCRGGIAHWHLARGPARNLWVPLCDGCAREMCAELPAGLTKAVMARAAERGDLPAESASLPVSPAASVPETAAGDTRQFVLAYLEEHADDQDLLDAIAELLGDGDDEDEPHDDEAAQDQPAADPAAPVPSKKPAAPKGKAPRKPARKAGGVKAKGAR